MRLGNALVSSREVGTAGVDVAGSERRVRFLDEKGVENVHGRRGTERVVDNEWKGGYCDQAAFLILTYSRIFVDFTGPQITYY